MYKIFLRAYENLYAWEAIAYVHELDGVQVSFWYISELMEM